jgi:acetyl/propionyl-CoA carboxylase alpha subunit
VRVESSLYRGLELNLYYDPMIAKLVAWGETRAEAILRMRRALSEYRIGGIKTCIPFHQEIMDSTEFIWGTFDTGFLARRRLQRETKPGREPEKLAAVVAALIAHEEGRQAVHIGGGEPPARATAAPWKMAGRLRAVRGRL